MSTRLGGRYQLVRELGAGGMGRVFQAVDTETGRTVAAKIMIGDEDNLDTLLRFQQEGAVLSTLKHPNIVEVYGTFLEEHTSCIIMELLEGQSLGQLLKTQGALPLPRVKRLMRQVASALAYAHGRAIVHRDVKPDNIMVVGDDQVKVTDFGIARILRSGATLNTATGMSIGTPLYMAPEQIEGQKVDGRADIYSFGAVMYQMVTGRPPFEGEDPLTVAFKHVHKAPQPPREVKAEIPEDWEALILKSLAKDPSDRFQTAAALEEAVAGLRGGESIVATPPLEPDGKPETLERIIDPQRRAPTVPRGTRPPEQPRTVPPRERPAAWTAPAQSPPPAAPRAGQQSAGGERPSVVRSPERSPSPAPGATVVGPVAGAGTLGEARVQPEPARRPVAAPPPVPHVQPAPVTQERKKNLPWLPMAAVAALLMVAIAVGAFFVLRGNSKSKPTAAPIPSLMTSGTVHLASGKTATLQWSEVPKATKYGLQIATSQLDPKDSVVFAHPLKTLTTSKTYYFMKVVGKQFYYWRVRARVSGKWGSFARSQHFLVSKPKVGIPAPRSPRNGAALRVKRVQLCWSPVQGAFEYSLRLNGSNMVVRSTCSSLRVKPQLYRWSVAARVKAALVYAGLRSPSFAFTVLKPRVKARPKPTPAPTSAPAPAPTTAPAPAPTVAPAPAPTTAPAPAPTYAPAPAPTTPPAPAPTTPPAPAPTTPSGPHCNPC